jgi:hypothetical protein
MKCAVRNTSQIVPRIRVRPRNICPWNDGLKLKLNGIVQDVAQEFRSLGSDATSLGKTLMELEPLQMVTSTFETSGNSDAGSHPGRKISCYTAVKT